MFILRYVMFNLLLVIVLLANDRVNALNYLNKLRVEAGLTQLVENSKLDVAAQNHTDYLNDTNTIGHYENDSEYPSSYYSGVIPSDRGASAGYYSPYYSENLSSGQNDIYASIDGLVSAIYHRYGFFDFVIDEIGIGLNYNNPNQKIFNYNMGNSELNALCDKTTSDIITYGSYYQASTICDNITDSNFKISKPNYDVAYNSISKISPKFIIWPPDNSTNILPAFYEESPDPLPDYSVSGYPVSIEFNDYYYKNSDIAITRFEIFDINHTKITDTRELNEANNPNPDHPLHHEFALFPLERLDYNSIYKVEVDYTIDGVSSSKEWSFKTKALPFPHYIIKNTSSTIHVISGQKYDIYIPPRHGNDTMSGYSVNYNTNVPTIGFFDANTLDLNVTGNIGQHINISTSNGFTINAVIASTDSAIANASQIISTKPTISSFSYTGEAKEANQLTFSVAYNLSSGRTLSNISYDYANDDSWSSDNTHTFEMSGTYVVKAKVTDTEGEYSIYSLNVVIAPLAFNEMSDEQKIKEAVNPQYYDQIMAIITAKEDTAKAFGKSYVETHPSEFDLVKISDINLTANKIATFSTGWTLISSPFAITDMSIFDNVNIIWIYSNGVWSAYSSSITTQTAINNAGTILIHTIPAGSGIWIDK